MQRIAVVLHSSFKFNSAVVYRISGVSVDRLRSWW